MKIQKVTYVVFVTATLMSAILLSIALHLTDPLVLKYEAKVNQLCASSPYLDTEADVLAACPRLSIIKDKITTLKGIRCDLRRLETNVAVMDEARRGQEIKAQKYKAQLLEQEIVSLLQEVEHDHALAQRL